MSSKWTGCQHSLFRSRCADDNNIYVCTLTADKRVSRAGWQNVHVMKFSCRPNRGNVNKMRE